MTGFIKKSKFNGSIDIHKHVTMREVFTPIGAIAASSQLNIGSGTQFFIDKYSSLF